MRQLIHTGGSHHLICALRCGRRKGESRDATVALVVPFVVSFYTDAGSPLQHWESSYRKQLNVQKVDFRWIQALM